MTFFSPDDIDKCNLRDSTKSPNMDVEITTSGKLFPLTFHHIDSKNNKLISWFSVEEPTPEGIVNITLSDPCSKTLVDHMMRIMAKMMDDGLGRTFVLLQARRALSKLTSKNLSKDDIPIHPKDTTNCPKC